MTVIPGYQLESVLGRGRYCVVYLAQRSRENRKVALKVAQRTQLESAGAATDLAGEFAALAALRHPNVIKALEHGVSGDAAYLAMECAAAGTVAQQCGSIAPARTASLMSQAASALCWLHHQGWVHRDVKPANLLLRVGGSLALGDFGSARRRGEAAARPEGSMAGTPRYAAPEQAGGAPAQPAEDVYGLGACLYEMLCGQALFPGETATELLGQHLLAPVPRLVPELAAWQPLLDAMLDKDPGRRLADGQAVLRRLQYLQHPGPEHGSRNPS